MNRTGVSWYRKPDAQNLIRRSAAAVLIILIWWSALALAQDASKSTDSTKPFSIRATHLLGFENAPRNANGTLSIQDDALQFQKAGKSAVQVKIASVQGISLGERDRQVGGVPMTLSKTAAPFGGGRVVSLFAHKKYDTFAFEYVDSNGGVHGAIFELDKGQSDLLKNELIAKGAHVNQSSEEPAKQTGAEVHNETN